MIESLLKWCLILAFAAVGVLAIYCFVVLLPATLNAEIKCARKGYPRAVVLFNLDTYCMNLDGSVTVKMEKLP